MVYLGVESARKRRKSHSRQTFEQIKVVKRKVCYLCLNKLTNMCIKSSGAVREAGSPEGQVFPCFHLIAVP